MEAYKDITLTIRQRVEDLINRMTVKEKVGQVNQHLYGWQVYIKNEDGSIELTDYFKKHVEWGGGLGALYGLFRADPWSGVDYDNGIPPEESKAVTELIQSYIRKNSRLGIPSLFVEECPHGHQALGSVSYPTNIGRGAMFNKQLIEKLSSNMAEELSMKGIHLALVSTLDLARDPRWGRTEECFGEDPFLASEYTEAVIKGFQGNMITSKANYLDKTVEEVGRERFKVGVVLKHFIAQGEALGGHNSGDVSIGPRELSDIYGKLMLSVKNAAGVMAAYNDIDGIPCHGNDYLLTDLLRKKIGFQGIVMADGGALDRLLVGHPTLYKKAAFAVKAGVDLSLWDHAFLSIEEGIKMHEIKEEDLDKAVRNVLGLKFLLGLFDEVDENSIESAHSLELKKKEWQRDNLQAAVESVTMIKNTNQTLPLSNISKLAVIGPNADRLYNQLGDYTPPQDSEYATTVLEGIKKEFPQTEVIYNEGCAVRADSESIAEAVLVAEDADAIVLVLGGSSARDFGMDFLSNGAVNTPDKNMDTGENIDVASLKLGGHQLKLLQALQGLDIPIITIMIQGRPYELKEVYDTSDAVLIAWYPGQRGGEALASILSGSEEPEGALPISIPYTSGQLPVYHNQKLSMKKAEYFDLPGEAFLSFGYGLQYSNVKVGELKAKLTRYSVEELLKGKCIQLSIELTNQENKWVNIPILCFASQRHR